MSKVLNFAGISRVAGELKFRTATEDSRFLQLTKLGDTDVEFIKITPTDSKQFAAATLIARNFANGRADVQALLEAVACKTSAPKSNKPKTVKARVSKKAKVTAKQPSVFDTKMSSKEAEKIREEFMKKLAVAYEANQ